MNSKERVLAALRRDRLPDRVPIQFDLSEALLCRFAEKYGIPVRLSRSYYEDLTWRISANDLRVAMGSDCVIVGATVPRGYQTPVHENGDTTNEFGMRMRQGPLYMDVVEFPLAGISSRTEAEEFQMPDPFAEGRFDDAARDIAKYRDRYFIVGDIELTVFSMMQQLVGLEKLLVDLATAEPYIEPLLEKTERFALAVGGRLVALGVDGIWAGDDFGTQKGLIMSPRLWRRYFKESYRRLYDGLKAVNPHVLIMQHCDGAVAPILNDWIEAGMEVFNPVQPNVPGHDPEDLKSAFGDRLSFWGAIDQQYLLPSGTSEEIEADVKRKIEILGRGGGYMISPAHIVQADVSPENMQAFIEAAQRHGVYAA